MHKKCANLFLFLSSDHEFVEIRKTNKTVNFKILDIKTPKNFK